MVAKYTRQGNYDAYFVRWQIAMMVVDTFVRHMDPGYDTRHAYADGARLVCQGPLSVARQVSLLTPESASRPMLHTSKLSTHRSR